MTKTVPGRPVRGLIEEGSTIPPEANPSRLIPDDEFNRELIRNVHPSDWPNPRPAGRYNLVVLGAGTAGLVTAAVAAGLGARVALVEKALMGGDCLNVGCVPSKALLRASRAWADLGRRASSAQGRGPDAVTHDFAEVMARMRRLRASLSPNDSARRFTSLGVDVFLGEGKFTGPETDPGRRRLAPLHEGRHLHRGSRRLAGYPGHPRGRIPDQRVRVQSH